MTTIKYNNIKLMAKSQNNEATAIKSTTNEPTAITIQQKPSQNPV